MTAKSQIEIEVNSGAFAEFKAAFDKYEAAISKMPKAWTDTGRVAGVARANAENYANNMKLVGASFASINTSGKEFYQVTLSTARHWKDLVLSTKNVASNIISATESLLKWGGIFALTGGASLFGFDRLARSVSEKRMEALGLGTTYGARAAFVTNFRRFGDPEGFLSRVARAQTNIQESVPLRLLVGNDLKGSPTEVAIRAFRRAAQIAAEDKTIGRPVGSDPRLNFLTTAERIRLRDHPEEVEEQIAQMRADQKSGRMELEQSALRKKFGHPVDYQKKYQDFTTQMERAENQIEIVFVKGLGKLTGPLEELSKSVTHLVEKFSDKALPEFINDLTSGIEWLAKEVNKPSFVAHTENIVTSIVSLASAFGGMLGALGRFARWIGVAPAEVPSRPGQVLGAGSGGEINLKGINRAEGAGGRRGFAARAFGGESQSTASQGSISTALAAARDQLRAEGVPEANINAAAEALVGNAVAESGLDPTKLHDKEHGQWTGYGIYGARLDRRDRMLAWLREHGYAANSLAGQQRYMAHEAMNDPKYAATRRALMGATNPLVAGDIVERDFERPRVFNNRHGAIRKVHGTASVSIHPVPGGNTGLGSAAAAAGSP